MYILAPRAHTCHPPVLRHEHTTVVDRQAVFMHTTKETIARMRRLRLFTFRRAGPMREVEEVDERLHVTPRQNVFADAPPVYALEVLLRRLISRKPRGILLRRGDTVAQPRLALRCTRMSRHGGNPDCLHLVDSLFDGDGAHRRFYIFSPRIVGPR